MGSQVAAEKTNSACWLGIVGSTERVKSVSNYLWWCVPPEAKKGDSLILYCPRAVSASRQGVYALCEISTNPDIKHGRNSYCSGFSLAKGGLRYVEFKVLNTFEKRLTAAMCKADRMLKHKNFVRRNFQGTVFALDQETLDHILSLVE
jgi:hypothetical protein